MRLVFLFIFLSIIVANTGLCKDLSEVGKQDLAQNEMSIFDGLKVSSSLAFSSHYGVNPVNLIYSVFENNPDQASWEETTVKIKDKRFVVTPGIIFETKSKQLSFFFEAPISIFWGVGNQNPASNDYQVYGSYSEFSIGLAIGASLKIYKDLGVYVGFTQDYCNFSYELKQFYWGVQDPEETLTNIGNYKKTGLTLGPSIELGENFTVSLLYHSYSATKSRTPLSGARFGEASYFQIEPINDKTVELKFSFSI